MALYSGLENACTTDQELKDSINDENIGEEELFLGVASEASWRHKLALTSWRSWVEKHRLAFSLHLVLLLVNLLLLTRYTSPGPSTSRSDLAPVLASSKSDTQGLYNEDARLILHELTMIVRSSQ